MRSKIFIFLYLIIINLARFSSHYACDGTILFRDQEKNYNDWIEDKGRKQSENKWKKINSSW